jgi:hypothetical protein
MAMRNLFFLILFILGICFTVTSHGRIDTYWEYNYTPVYGSIETIRNNYMIYPLGGSLSNPGEMIILNNLLLISCKYSGIAIYDITDPNNVIQEAYISIPGHFRMIERDGIIWADSYTDLVVIDPKEGRNCELLWIVKDILPYDPLDLLHGIYTEYTSHEVHQQSIPFRRMILYIQENQTAN